MGNDQEEMRSAVAGRVLLLDGAMGSLLQREGLTEADFRGQRWASHQQPLLGDNETLNLTRPEVVAKVHRLYLDAGCDLITTNTFGANRICQADYGLSAEARELAQAGAAVARQCADERNNAPANTRRRYVCGSLGPTNKTASLSPDAADPGCRAIDYDTLRTAYREQAAGLLDGGVDALLLETVFDGLNAKAALAAIEEELEERGLRHFPLMVSATIADRSGRILSGQTPAALLTALERADLLTFGLNCSLGPGEMGPYLTDLSRRSPFALCAYPNAGLPDELGRYRQGPEEFAKAVEPLLREGKLNIVGGCCGTTPDHIRALRELIDREAKPRSVYYNNRNTDERRPTRLSGLDELELDPGRLTLVGERCNVAGSRRFLRLIKECEYEQALEVAREEVRQGADILDVNFDDGLLDARHEMQTFLNLLMSEPEVARHPVMLDSSRWEVVEAGLEVLQGRSVVNSLSLKHGEAELLRQAAIVRRHGAMTVAMLFDEKGQATTLERRQSVASRLYRLLTEEAGLQPEDIIFDPNILAIATGLEGDERVGVELLEAIAWLHREFPRSHISGGLSNLSFAFRGNERVRGALHAVFLELARPRGLDMAIVNPASRLSAEGLPEELREAATNVILNRAEGAPEQLVRVANAFSGEGEAPPRPLADESWRQLPPEQRLSEDLVRGETKYLSADLEAALEGGVAAMGLVDGPLMAGMETVGERFGRGEMFLPQVVKTARVMREAVEALRPLIEAEKEEAASQAGCIVLATVKGDVHDIGKNIVAVVMQCNNWRVVDLGVMVEPEAVAEAVEREQADAVGLSGLITPSLDEMRHTLEVLARRGIRVPVLIGGATTSELHTALRLAPVYEGPVVHVADAAANATVLHRIQHDADGSWLRALRDRQEALRQAEGAKGDNAAKTLTLDEARAHAPKRDWTAVHCPRPAWQGVATLNNIDLQQLIPLLNWRLVAQGMGVTPGAEAREAASETPESASPVESPVVPPGEWLNEARAWLTRLVDGQLLRAHGVVGIFPAQHIEGDDVVLYADEATAGPNGERLGLFTFPRQRRPDSHGNCLSLSDYIAPPPHLDHIGLFAATAGEGEQELLHRLRAAGDERGAIVCQALAGALAEALSEWLHWRTRTALWGYDTSEPFDPDTLLHGRYRGIRPAIGYPICPDHALKRTLFDILGVEMLTPIRLTESTMMTPAASVCGLYFEHDFARYFAV